MLTVHITSSNLIDNKEETMLIYDLEQGSDEWHKLRLGVITASNLDKVITPTGSKSGQFDKYMNKLIAELLTGEEEQLYFSDAMQRGIDLEAEAVLHYGAQAMCIPKSVGFILRDDGRVGVSPDRVIRGSGLLEVKCPLQTTHTANLISGEIDKKYIPQVQGQMWIAEREWCDWMSYHPDLPASIVRIERDDEFIAKMSELIDMFVSKMDTKINILKDKGVTFKAGFGNADKTD